MLDLKKQITSEIQKAVKDLTGQNIIPSLFHPTNLSFGDYSTNIALALFAKSKIDSPMDLAQEIAAKLKVESRKLKVLEKVEVAKPGFINFWLSKEYLLGQLKNSISSEKPELKPQDLNKKVVVEYSSPNIAKPFTVGHLRSTIIGDAIANLLEAMGWKVYRDNHLGDWGTQFGKLIYAIKTWGNEREIERAKNPIKILVDLYVKFHQEAEKNSSLEDEGRKWFKKLEEGDTEARRLWQKCVAWSLREFEKIYQELGIEFTENSGLGYGESFFEDKIQPVIKELKKKKLLTESEDAELVFFPKDKLSPLMILKKDGTTLYATRDLATDKFRLERYGKDIVVINEVGNEQSLYFNQLFEVEKMLGWYKEKQRVHIKHGLYRFKNGKMSTRKGNVIWLEDVLKEAVKRALDLSSEKDIEIAEKVGIGAIKWNDLKRSSNLDIVFDWDEILNMEGNSGPYLQYTYARTQSVLAKVKSQKSKVKSEVSHFAKASRDKQNSKFENEEILLLRTIYRFPEAVGEAAEKFAPNILCNYLFELAQSFNLFYQKHPIIRAVPEIRDFRLALTMGVGKIIKNGLNLLGISAPEKM